MFIVEIAMTKPSIPTSSGQTTCQNRSWVASECLDESDQMQLRDQGTKLIPCYDEGADCSKDPRRRTEQKRNSVTEAHRLAKCWEEGIEAKRDDHRSQCQRQPPDFPIRKRHNKAFTMRHFGAFILVTDTNILFETFLCKPAF